VRGFLVGPLFFFFFDALERCIDGIIDVPMVSKEKGGVVGDVMRV